MKRFSLRQVKPASIETGFPELINAAIFNDDDSINNHVFSQYYSSKEILDWFNENISFILNEVEPTFLPKANCLAEAIEMFYRSLSDDDLDNGHFDSMLDTLFEYKTRHDLKFAFRGTDIPNVFLGVYRGHLTVSWQESDTYVLSTLYEPRLILQIM